LKVSTVGLQVSNETRSVAAAAVVVAAAVVAGWLIECNFVNLSFAFLQAKKRASNANQ